jgi:hypothetical protein
VSAGPDVAGLLEALAALSDRTPEQRRAYAVQLDTVRWSQDDEDEGDFEEAAAWVLANLDDAKLSKAARKAITDHLGVPWPDA